MSEHGAAPDHWFEPIAEHLGGAYLRYSFTKGTVQEVDVARRRRSDFASGHDRVLDVGCGPGRHCARARTAWHRRSTASTSAQRFIELAAAAADAAGLSELATFERLDAREAGRSTIEFDGRFDAAVSLCQGAFGLMTAQTATIASPCSVASPARCAPAGCSRVSAFNAYFSRQATRPRQRPSMRTPGSAHERTEVRNEAGVSRPRWTSGQRLLHPARAAAARRACVRAFDRSSPSASIEPGSVPGDDAHRRPSQPEFLVIARRDPDQARSPRSPSQRSGNLGRLRRRSPLAAVSPSAPLSL